MSRSIKFRAWDSVNKRIIYDYFYVGSEGAIWQDQDPNGVDISGRRRIGLTTRFEIMQYIGLKDKNGKEIYEGDILKTSRTVSGLLMPNGKVAELFGINREDCVTQTWDEILIAKFKVTDNSVSFTLPEEGGTYQERGKKLEWEIIGNVYQTPDLIPKA